MQRWSRLNERQLALLTRIGAGRDPVSSDHPDLALTARALKERGLIAMPKAAGKRWQAEITDAGRFYLEHDRHPDQPPRGRRQASSANAGGESGGAPRRAAAGTRPRAAVGPALIEEVQQAGRFLRIPDPDEAERARYRRAFDAARTCAPAGYHLKYSGRAKGDFVLGLLRVTGEDDTEWNRIRLQRSRTISDVDEVLAAVRADHSAFEVSEEVLPRVLSIIRLLAQEALARHGEVTVSKKRRQPRPMLMVHGRTYELSVRERQKQVPYVPAQNGRRRTYDWQRTTPAHRSEPSGELELHITQQHGYSYAYGSGWKKEWADTPKQPLETRVGSVFRALKTRAEEQERARLEREAEQRRLQAERERQEAERRRREAEERERTRRVWESAVAEAQGKAIEANRAERFGTALERWRTAGEIREFCTALEETATGAPSHAEAERLRQWSAYGRAKADQLDPTAGEDCLSAEDFDAQPTGDALRPFLDGWHPDRPEKGQAPAEPEPPKLEPDPWRGVSDALQDQGWRHGHQGRAQWWRR